MKLATDIGGTFTDLVYLDDTTGSIGTSKSSSTPPNFAQGILDTITKAEIDAQAVEHFVHGTTVVINALTERKGARTALITTKGFRDVLAIGRANRPDIYNLRFKKQEPFVPREHRFEVEERLDYLGDEVTPLNEREVLEVAAEMEREGITQGEWAHPYQRLHSPAGCGTTLRHPLRRHPVQASSLERPWPTSQAWKSSNM